MPLRVSDPGQRALRRGVRAAVGVPVTVGLAIWLLPHTPAGLVGVFGSMGLIATADFGGSPRHRLASLLGAGAAGAIVISIGAVAGLTTVSAVLATLVVGSVLAFSAVLRGSVASGAPALTVVYVASTTVGVALHEAWTLVAGWGIAVAVSTAVSMTILPRPDARPIRDSAASALAALADAVEARSAGRDIDAAPLERANSDLQRSYLGNPFRASGIDARGRAVLVLVGQVQAVLAALTRGGAYPFPMEHGDTTARLVRESARALRAAALCLTDPGAPAPSGLELARLWEHQWDEGVDRLMATDQGPVPQRVDSVFALFPDRAMAIATVRIVALVREVIGAPPEDYPTGEDLHSIPGVPRGRSMEEVRAQATLRSPWARLAVRSGVALAAAVLVVSLTGLAHGFWVVLGVTAILRMDGLTTLRTAGLALAGTALGAAVGVFLLDLDRANVGWLWLGLVLATFTAVWAQAAIGFVLGQAAFSLFVIIACSLLNWPPDLATAGQRLQDIAVGAAVSVAVAFLLWPRGVLSGMRANFSEAIRLAARSLEGSVDAIVNGYERLDPRAEAESSGALTRSQEVIDLSLSSTGRGAADFAYAWQLLVDNLRTPIVAAHLFAEWAKDRPPIATAAPGLAEPVLAEAAGARAAWQAVAAEIDDGRARERPQEPATLDRIGAVTTTLDLGSRVVADRVTAAIWTHAWLSMSLNAAQSSVAPSRHSPAGADRPADRGREALHQGGAAT